MNAGLQLRTTQTLALSPQLRQAMWLLQMSTLDLQEQVQSMLAENPFLERDEDSGAEDAAAPQPEPFGREDFAAPATDAVCADQDQGYATAHAASDDWNQSSAHEERVHTSDDASAGETELSAMHTLDASGEQDPQEDEARLPNDAAAQTLAEHLHEQARCLRLGEQDRAALMCLIEWLNDDGYLEDGLGEIAQNLMGQLQSHSEDTHHALLHHLTVALRLLQSFEPAGVGARDLGECLQLQLRALPIDDADTERLLLREAALALCQQPLQHLARRDVRTLARLCRCQAPLVQQAMRLIATLEPKPARRFAQTPSHIIIPDVIVRATAHGAWSVEPNPAAMPRLRVHETYAQALRQHRSADGAQALAQRLQEARWLVRGVRQRAETILRISRAIVARQSDFLTHGAHAMRALVLRDIATELGMHESTISRATAAKYMATPQGTFELKYFFGISLAAQDGQGDGTSATAVRARIAQLIASENGGKPYSDQCLSALLQEQGIACARRTVAKYRESLKIAPAHLRKSLPAKS